MKIIRKTVTGGGTLLLFVAMYKCFVYGAPLQGSERTLYMMLTAIFCIFAWMAVMGTIWYVKWLRRKNTELKKMIDTLLKSTDELDK